MQEMSKNFGSGENLGEIIDLIAALGDSLSSQPSQGKRGHEGEPRPRDAPAKKRKPAQPGEEDIDDTIQRKCAGNLEHIVVVFFFFFFFFLGGG